MKSTKLGIAVMALMGAFAQKADPKKQLSKSQHQSRSQNVTYHRAAKD